jgi:hypothetical protein
MTGKHEDNTNKYEVSQDAVEKYGRKQSMGSGQNLTEGALEALERQKEEERKNYWSGRTVAW